MRCGDAYREIGALGTGGWVEGDRGAWDGRWVEPVGTLGMEGWVEGDRVIWDGRMVEGDGDTWDGRLGRRKWGLLGWEDGLSQWGHLE